MYQIERKTSPNYPFSESMVFCGMHDHDSDIIDVIECEFCFSSNYRASHPMYSENRGQAPDIQPLVG